MEIFDIECLTSSQLREICLFSIPYERRGSFLIESENMEKKYEILHLAKLYIPITLKTSVEYCLYCDEKLKEKGLFCDSECENLYQEDKEDAKNQLTCTDGNVLEK